MAILPHTLIACIGPITANTARELGLRVDIMASEYTMDGLVTALGRTFCDFNHRDTESQRLIMLKTLPTTHDVLDFNQQTQHSAISNQHSALAACARIRPFAAWCARRRSSPDDFIYPLFVTHGKNVKNEISSMPGVYQWSPDQLAREAESIAKLGIPAVILFGLPEEKDPIGLENFAADGIVQQATRVIKQAVPEMIVVTDVCLCEYTDHGHCGILERTAIIRICRKATC